MGESKHYFIDTNIFLRVFAGGDEEGYIECLKLLEAVKLGKISAATSSIVLAEIVWVLSSFYKLSKKDTIVALDSIHNLHGLAVIDAYDAALSLELYKSHNVKYIDCLLAAAILSDKKSWCMISYDKDFDKLGIERETPGKIILDYYDKR